jgi:hypothetical protein
MGEGGYRSLIFMGGLAGRDENNLIQATFCHRCISQLQVAEMNRIKRASQQSYIHSGYSLICPWP